MKAPIATCGQSDPPTGNGHISTPRLVFQATRRVLEIMLLRGDH
ncbi:hypothetical protein [Streptomyces mirabilis]